MLDYSTKRFFHLARVKVSMDSVGFPWVYGKYLFASCGCTLAYFSMTSLPLKLSLWQSCATWQSAWPLAVSLTTSSDKENPFGSIAKVLGLKINLEDARLGKIYMCNTESRQQELFESLSAVLEKSFLSRKDGERLRGRMQFAEAQIAGKAAGLAAKLASSGTAQEVGGALQAAVNVDSSRHVGFENAGF